MVMVVVSVPLSTTNCSTSNEDSPEIALTKSLKMNERTRKHGCFFA